ncbi:MAG TPA: GGDEF domain-containing protein [Ideonella sp.]|nr:GGDEF domain-containing protein [Ideonella sp.]
MSLTHRSMAALLAGACAWGAPAAMPAAVPAVNAYAHMPFEDQIDGLVRDGYEHSAESVAALELLLADGRSSDQRRQLLQAIGGVEAQAGSAVRAGNKAERLLAMSTDGSADLALASSNLVRAQVAENAGELDVAAALAQAALPVFSAGCKLPVPAVAGQPQRPCEYRSAWRALQLLQRRAMSQGLPAAEAGHAQAALALAERAGDTRRQTTNLASLALLAQGRGEQALADRLMAKAQRLATLINDVSQQARMSDIQARLDAMRGDHAMALRHLEAARAMAAAAGAPRLEARMLTNLSDAYARLGQPGKALRAAERALPVVRRNGDLGTERVLINNSGIAKIGLGRIAEGKADMARLLELWQRSGETGRQVETLREFGEALAGAGDARSAIELFHKEQSLSAALMKANRSLALKDLQARNDAEARQRDIDLLSRDNASKTQALVDRERLQRLWWLLALLMVSATVAVALLYKRVRETNRRLAASHRQLKLLSERDPLTNLANRRHFQAVMSTLVGEGGFEGALFLVDIDHFKRINDERGHAAGDEVLVEVARRLNAAVRGDDLVVRWGGEEFLILAPRASVAQSDQIAQRVLGSLGSTAVRGGQQSFSITVSIGHGRFPLAPHAAPTPWEQALNLVDMALYTAKNQGRNRAVGIRSVNAATPDLLRRIEGDFERAWQEGRVSLSHALGPQAAGERRAQGTVADGMPVEMPATLQ